VRCCVPVIDVVVVMVLAHQMERVVGEIDAKERSDQAGIQKLVRPARPPLHCAPQELASAHSSASFHGHISQIASSPGREIAAVVIR